MPDYKNIVCGTDFSEGAQNAFNEAKHMAELAGAKLHVVHVVPGSAGGPREGEASPAEYAQRYPAENAEYHVLHGHEAEQIIKFADALPDPLIVVGARGVGIITGLFGGGSICDKLVANATSPVMVVPSTKR
jgi:nucleotide-binding universal stress UspA family protein